MSPSTNTFVSERVLRCWKASLRPMRLVAATRTDTSGTLSVWWYINRLGGMKIDTGALDRRIDGGTRPRWRLARLYFSTSNRVTRLRRDSASAPGRQALTLSFDICALYTITDLIPSSWASGRACSFSLLLVAARERASQGESTNARTHT